MLTRFGVFTNWENLHLQKELSGIPEIFWRNCNQPKLACSFFHLFSSNKIICFIKHRLLWSLIFLSYIVLPSLCFFLSLNTYKYVLNFGLLGSDAMQPVDGHHLFGEPAMYTLKVEDVPSYTISWSRRSDSISSPQSKFEIFIDFMFHHANKSDIQWYKVHEFINVVCLKISTLIYISLKRRKSTMMIRHFPHLIRHWDGCGVIERAGTTIFIYIFTPFYSAFLIYVQWSNWQERIISKNVYWCSSMYNCSE